MGNGAELESPTKSDPLGQGAILVESGSSDELSTERGKT